RIPRIYSGPSARQAMHLSGPGVWPARAAVAHAETLMLRTLSIRNFAIIDRLDLEFGPGFNVLTGETGAGKSILMDALNLLLGSRSGAEMVRSGSEKAVVDAVFDLS